MQSELSFPWSDPPASAKTIEVCEGIRWCQHSLPFALDHVNCWLLGDPVEPVIVDTGINSATTREQWNSILGAKDKKTNQALVEQLVATHFHPDHIGLAGWFESAGAICHGNQTEIDFACSLWPIDDKQYGEFYADWYASNGLPLVVQEAARKRGNSYKKIVHELPMPENWTPIRDDQILTLGGQEYRVIIGRGHAPEMIMLYRSEGRILIAADQVLPSISPNVSVMPRLMDPNPLASFLETLDRLKQLPEETLVLPSHGLPFYGLHSRIKALEIHHQERLTLVEDACAEPCSAYDLFSVLFKRELDAQQMSFALGESLAHLHFLEHQNRICRLEDQNVVRFQRT